MAGLYSAASENWKMKCDVVTCGDTHLLSFLKHPEERSHGANIEGVCGDGHDVVQDASHLTVKNYESVKHKWHKCGKYWNKDTFLQSNSLDIPTIF